MQKVLAALVWLALAVPSWAQPGGKPAPAAKQPAASRPAESSKPKAGEPDAALRQAIAGHAKAIRTGDYKAAAAFWTSEGDYADSSGQLTAARQALEQRAATLPADAGPASQDAPARATLTSGTVRMVTPDMAVEDGTAELSAEPGESASRGTYTAVWIRQQGKWLLSSFREIGPRGPADGAASLDELEWLAGRWQAEQKGNRVDVDCHWAPGKRFLLRDLQVTHNDGTIQHIHQRIGLAGSTGGIRSWSFDRDGGTAEGNWTKKGREWLVTLNGVRSDGTVTSGKAVYSQIGSDQFDFETTDASVGGQPRPAVKLQFHRQVTPAIAGPATPRDPADQASRDKILDSPAWRDTLAAFRDWISAQPYTPEELARMKAEYQQKIDTLSAEQLPEFLAESQRKLQVLSSPASQEARQWVASQMALMTRYTPDQIETVRPDIFKLSAAELEQQVVAVQAKRAQIAQSRAAFNKANARNLQAINNMMAQQDRERSDLINRPSVSMPYGSALQGGVRQYDYKPQTANLGVWVW